MHVDMTQPVRVPARAATRRRHRRAAAHVLAALALSGAASPAWAAAPEAPVYPSAGTMFDLQSLLSMAEQGDKRAAFLLGSRYASGRGGLRDDSEAVRWFRRAAEAGLAEAQYNLGIMYASGRGVKPDLAEAARWYRRAADQGLAEAQFNLGTLYGTGRGVGRDEGRAAAWLERAAERGLARAQYNLGVLYEHGRGVRLDGQQALAWYQRAAEQGFEPAAARFAALQRRLQAPAKDRAQPADEAAQDREPPAGVAVGVPAASSADEPEPVRGAAAPAPGAPEPGAVDGVGGWVAGLDAERFTVQLASFTSLQDATRFLDALPGDEGRGIYRSTKRGRRWFSVVRGDYPSYAAAEDAVAALPQRLRRIKPWIRKLGRIHDEMD